MNAKVFAASPFLGLGLDRLVRGLETSVEAQRAQSYPPYNLIRISPTQFQIVVALAGFKPDEITVETEENVLAISGAKSEVSEYRNYIHRGIGVRNFTRKFHLEDLIEVRSASFEHGLLSITFERVIPEAQQKRVIPINGVTAAPAEAAE